MIEVLVVVALVAVVMGIAISSLSGSGSAQLRQASTRVAAAVRVAYARATAAGRVVRLVFDFGGSTIAMGGDPRSAHDQEGLPERRRRRHRRGSRAGRSGGLRCQSAASDLRAGGSPPRGGREDP
ncbi:MAG: hypothetical protein IPG04_11995 [Polyangiaceae bacterium]|nr:hypothetical protein [Polyangiaceae bacterium]